MIASAVAEHNVNFIGGDFNMALFKTQRELQKRGVNTVFLGSWAWRQKENGVPVPGFAGVRFDSMGLFAVGEVTQVPNFTRWIKPSMLTGKEVTWDTGSQDRLPEFFKSAGFAASSYGGEELVKSHFMTSTSERMPPTHGDGEYRFPRILQKKPRHEITDAFPDNRHENIIARGVHCPCTWFVGQKSWRAPESQARRHDNAVKRGWGKADRRAWAQAGWSEGRGWSYDQGGNPQAPEASSSSWM